MTIKWPERKGGRRSSALAGPVIFNMLLTIEASVKSIDSRQLCLILRFQLKPCAQVLGVVPKSPIRGVRVVWPECRVTRPRIPEVEAQVRPHQAADSAEWEGNRPQRGLRLSSGVLLPRLGVEVPEKDRW